MWMFCCGTRRSRFKSIAEPALKDLHKRKLFVLNEGQKYSDWSVQQKKEAVSYYSQNNNFAAEAKAIEALRNDKMAQRYMKILKIIDAKINQVEQLWAQHDLVDNAGASAQQLEKIGLVQRDELDGTDEFPSVDARIDAVNKTEKDFTKLVEEMDEEIQKVQIENIQDDVDVFRQIQTWNLGKYDNQIKELTPNQLVMTSEDES